MNIGMFGRGSARCGGVCNGLSIAVSYISEVLVIGCARVFGPLIWAVELLNKRLGQKSLHVAKEDDVVLAVEVDPAVVAVLRIVALRLAGSHAIENLVERLVVDIAKSDVKILTEWHVTVTMDDEATHDALAAQAQMPIAPLVVECHKVEVLLCL